MRSVKAISVRRKNAVGKIYGTVKIRCDSGSFTLLPGA
jgi:hypothetical protein